MLVFFKKRRQFEDLRHTTRWPLIKCWFLSWLIFKFNIFALVWIKIVEYYERNECLSMKDKLHLRTLIPYIWSPIALEEKKLLLSGLRPWGRKQFLTVRKASLAFSRIISISSNPLSYTISSPPHFRILFLATSDISNEENVTSNK